MPTKVLNPAPLPRQRQQKDERSYLLPQHLPAQPTTEDLIALEQYLSRVSGSTETLHQGLAKVYLPSVLQGTAQSGVPHRPFLQSQDRAAQEFQQQGPPSQLAPFPDVGFFERFKQLAHGLSPLSGHPLTEERSPRLPLSGTPFPFAPAPTSVNRFETLSDRGTLPGTTFPTDPAIQEPPSKPLRSRENDKDSLAPSQSPSQVALRKQQRAKQLGQPLVSESSDRPQIREGEEAEESQSKKDMALLDWARSVSGARETSHLAQNSERLVPGSAGMNQTSQYGGTDVDNGGGSGSSSTSVDNTNDRRRETGFPVGDGSFEDHPQPNPGFQQEQHRQGSAWGDATSTRDIPTVQQQPEYTQQYLYPGPYPFPQQPPNGLTRASSVRHSAPPSQFGWQSPRITEHIPRDDEVSLMERMTIGGTTLGGLTTAGGVPYSSMSRMRLALERDAQGAQRQEEHEVRSATSRAERLRSASSEVDRLQSQVRTLQARIIAEHVSRSSLERDVVDKTDEAREYRSELGNAIRALKRAKEETRKLDEERKKGMRLYEETKERLVKYHEALKVQEARDAGREEGRLEAFHEIARWMTAPPIPIEPVGTLPPTVMRHMDQAQGRSLGGATHGDNRLPAGDERQPQRNEQYDDRQYQADQSHQQRPPHSSDPSGYQQQGHAPSREYRQDSSQLPHQGGTENNMDPRLGYQPSHNATQHPHRPSPGQTAGFVPVRQTPPILPDRLTPLNAADAYLDRVQHDSRLQGMLTGPPSRSLPFTSNNTGPGYSQNSGGHPSQVRRHSSNPSNLDKPLPAPHLQHRRYVSNGDQSAFGGSPPGGHGRTSIRSGRQHGGSLSKSHSKAHRGISQPDRYPPFQAQARSILDHAVPVLSPDDQTYAIPPGYVDPRHIPLPDSRTVSEFGGSVHPTRQGGGPSFVSQGAATNRSRLAVGLRNEDDLSMIEEREERSTGGEHSPRGQLQNMQPSRGNVKAARSMQSLPSWKLKPKIVLPKRLGAPRTDVYDMSDEQMREFYAQQQAGVMGGNTQPSTNAFTPNMTSANMRVNPHDMNLRGQNEDKSQAPERDMRRDATTVSVNPAHIPLPPTRHGTVFTEAPERTFPGISVIDFARTVPLPESRAPTILGTYGERDALKATVETIEDRDAPHHRLPGSILKRPSSADGSPSAGRRKTSSA